METKLWLVAAALALTECFFPLVFSFAAEGSPIPASPKILLLAGLVTLALLCLPSTSSIENSNPKSRNIRKQRSRATVHRDVQEKDGTCSPCDSSAWTEAQIPSSGGITDDSSSSSRFDLDVHPWTLLLLSAICGTAASNITLGFLGTLPCYAFTQLALLKVVAVVLISSNSSKKLRTSFNTTGQVALGLIVLAVCAGQGVFGGTPQPSASHADDASMLQPLQDSPSVVAPAAPFHVFTLATVAAILSALALQFLALAQHAMPEPQQEPEQQRHHHLIIQVVLSILCNCVWLLLNPGELEGFFEDMVPSFWHGILLLGSSGMLTSALIASPGTDQLVAKAYAYQAAVVLSAWGSSLLLEEPQTTLFAFCSLLSGMAVLLLHSSQHEAQMQHPAGGGKSDSQAKHMGHLRTGKLDLAPLRQLLCEAWMIATLLLLCLTAWATIEHNASQYETLAFSHPASAQALHRTGITLEDLRASTDAPFPLDALYQSTSWAIAEAESAQGRNTSAGESAQARRSGASHAGMQSPAWALCPALTCSREPSCKVNCCAHLHLHMMAFWDAFMTAHGLEKEYVVLYDTLRGAAAKSPPMTQGMHLGLTAQAAMVLEEPCLKKKLWQHGYAFFLQGDKWRLCAHRHHPSPIFKQHMHAARHLGLHHDQDTVTLHIMWPHTDPKPQSQLQASTVPPRSLSRAASLLGIQSSGASTWQLCSVGAAALTTRPGHTVSLNGLQLPAPVDADKQLTQTYEQATAASRSARPLSKVNCEELVSDLLVRVGF